MGERVGWHQSSILILGCRGGGRGGGLG